MKPPGWPGAARARRDEWLVGGLLAGLAFVLAAGAWTWRADRVLYDFGLSWFERPSSKMIAKVATLYKLRNDKAGSIFSANVMHWHDPRVFESGDTAGLGHERFC